MAVERHIALACNRGTRKGNDIVMVIHQELVNAKKIVLVMQCQVDVL